MNWTITFLGIIAIAEVGGLILNATNRAWQKANDLLSRQLERERGIPIRIRSTIPVKKKALRAMEED